jgi:hypothetical protein
VSQGQFVLAMTRQKIKGMSKNTANVFNQGEGDNGKKKKNSILRLPTERMT